MIALLEPPRTSEPNTDRLEELVKTVSASRLNLWNNCRLKFYFRYVLQISKPKTAALFVGSLVHAILQSWSMARWKKEPFDLDKYKAQFDEQWKEQQAKARIDWEGEEDKERTGAWNAIECYFKQTPISEPLFGHDGLDALPDKGALNLEIDKKYPARTCRPFQEFGPGCYADGQI